MCPRASGAHVNLSSLLRLPPHRGTRGNWQELPASYSALIYGRAMDQASLPPCSCAPRLSGWDTFPDQVHVAIRQQDVDQLQVPLHVPGAHSDHLCRKKRTLSPQPDAGTAAGPLRKLSGDHLTLNNCSSFSRKTWIISRRRWLLSTL